MACRRMPCSVTSVSGRARRARAQSCAHLVLPPLTCPARTSRRRERRGVLLGDGHWQGQGRKARADAERVGAGADGRHCRGHRQAGGWVRVDVLPGWRAAVPSLHVSQSLDSLPALRDAVQKKSKEHPVDRRLFRRFWVSRQKVKRRAGQWQARQRCTRHRRRTNADRNRRPSQALAAGRACNTLGVARPSSRPPLPSLPPRRRMFTHVSPMLPSHPLAPLK